MGDEQQEIGKVKAKSDYSPWTLEESKVLLQLLVESTLRGWCDANGLLTKDIVMTIILPALNERLNRMRYFKKEYGKYSQLMRSNFGFGWDANTKRFVADDEVWEEYFRVNLQIVLGDATATEEHSLGMGEEIDARTFVVKDRQGGIEEDEQTTNKARIMENISLTLGSITTDFREVHKKQNSIWDAIKEILNLDEPACYQAVALLDTKTKKDAFLKISPKKKSNLICYNLKQYVI
ncbi:hypothetical protein D8674_019250 [Pyrus ussuriensis x Pyrus communis]|uniref:Uncharacterized protein n=1 Tax=Pyrus ussuriensis x Pyrus communis TaxID=2448454 RepID=A0A5N5G7H2_9ROSA|nr:hypothetical protein D8674_019250 [Pyrus ussuriensis x Pyrus communis]